MTLSFPYDYYYRKMRNARVTFFAVLRECFITVLFKNGNKVSCPITKKVTLALHNFLYTT